MASSSSLSNVVSNLVKAQMGSSVPNSITDEDLDRHIGEIILREAKAKAERYKKEGIRAYLPRPDPNVPKANKRFLSSIIKNTDEHNKAIQRTQEQLRQEREEQDRKEKMRRAQEAAAVRRASESLSGRRQYHYGRGGVLEDRWRPEDDDEKGYERKRRKRDWAKDFKEGEVKKQKRREHSPRSFFRPTSSADEPREKDADQRRSRSRSRPPSPPIEPPSLPPSPPGPSSKMDKYFEPDYDPRLDVAPLTNNGRLTVNVPATGLIDDPSWDSWEAMLDLIKLKREDRMEKKRLERLGLLPEVKKSSGGSGKKGKGLVSASVPGEDRGLMDIAYTKRGTVREWDMGKEIE